MIRNSIEALQRLIHQLFAINWKRAGLMGNAGHQEDNNDLNICSDYDRGWINYLTDLPAKGAAKSFLSNYLSKFTHGCTRVCIWISMSTNTVKQIEIKVILLSFIFILRITQDGLFHCFSLRRSMIALNHRSMDGFKTSNIIA